MTLSDIALKRPVGSIVLSLIILLFGIVGYNFLGVRLYPAIDPPIINVQNQLCRSECRNHRIADHRTIGNGH